MSVRLVFKTKRWAGLECYEHIFSCCKIGSFYPFLVHFNPFLDPFLIPFWSLFFYHFLAPFYPFWCPFYLFLVPFFPFQGLEGWSAMNTFFSCCKIGSFYPFLVPFNPFFDLFLIPFWSLFYHFFIPLWPLFIPFALACHGCEWVGC